MEVKIKGNIKIGGHAIAVIAGPCSIANQSRLNNIAGELKRIGVKIMRAGAFKPRTNCKSFQGLGYYGLSILNEVKNNYNIAAATEITCITQLEKMMESTDIIQVGTRNMANYELLKALGKVDKPILLKRGMSATIDEFLQAAEYITQGGNEKVILCERGLRSFDNSTRNLLDISAIPVIKSLSGLPVIVDPSHATGRRDLIQPVSLAAIAAGADGLIIEADTDPDTAMSDKEQTISTSDLAFMLEECEKVANAVGRTLDLATHKVLAMAG